MAIFTALISLALLGTNSVLANITIHCGQLSVEGYNHCEITHNDHVMNYTGPDKKLFPETRFGLITYRCDHTAGILVSEIDCEACDFHCPEEESSIDCQEGSIPIWSGVMLGMSLAAAINYSIFWFLNRTPTPNTRPWFKPDFRFFKRNQRERLHTSDEHATRKDNVDGSKAQNKGEKATLKSSAPLGKRTVVSVIASILLFQIVSACDYTVVRKDNSTVLFCDHVKCSRGQPSSFTIRTGEEICIEGQTTRQHMGSLKVSEITLRSKYALSYYTSEYEIVGGAAVVQCCRSGYEFLHNCSNTDFKKLEAEHKLLEYEGRVYLSPERENVHFDLKCFYIKNQRIGELYPIYSLVEQQMVTNVVVGKAGAFHNLIVNTYDPTHLLTELNLYTTDTISFSVPFPAALKKSDVILYDDKAFYINASKINEPVSDSFGDLQVSLDKQKELYSTAERIYCSIPSYGECTCDCTIRETKSKISEFVNRQDFFEQPTDYVIRKPDNSSMDVFETLQSASLQMKVHDSKFDNLDTKKGECDIQLLTTYACATCNESSYIALQAQNIQREGHVSFYSNCSFEYEYINCDLEPTKLILMDNHRYCHIWIPTLRKRLEIEMKFYDFKELSKSASGDDSKPPCTFERLLFTFIRSMMKTVIVGSLLGLIPVVLLRKFQQFKEKRGREKRLSQQIFEAVRAEMQDEA